MFNLSFPVFYVALCTFGALVAADFTQPSSSLGDLQQQWRVGDTIPIAWNAGWDWGVGGQPAVADLFVMWSDRPTEFSQLVQGWWSPLLMIYGVETDLWHSELQPI